MDQVQEVNNKVVSVAACLVKLVEFWRKTWTPTSGQSESRFAIDKTRHVMREKAQDETSDGGVACFSK